METQDNASRLRGLETIHALSAIFGFSQPPDSPGKQDRQTANATVSDERGPVQLGRAEAESVAAWSVGVQQRKQHRDLSPESAPPSDHDPTYVCDLEEDEDEATGRGVVFRATVSIVEIPHHRDLPSDIVQSVWASSEEVEENRERNLNEYRSVGGVWTNVLEEHQMIYDQASGEYIHPATWEQMQMDCELERLAQQEMERRAHWREEQKRKDKHKPTNSAVHSPPRRRLTKGPPQTDPHRSPNTSPRRNKRRGTTRPQAATMASLTRFADT